MQFSFDRFDTQKSVDCIFDNKIELARKRLNVFIIGKIMIKYRI